MLFTMKQHTEREIKLRREEGCREMTLPEITKRMADIGYTLKVRRGPEGDGWYHNMYNPGRYHTAQHTEITDEAGLSFAHIQANKRNLDGLQELRMIALVVVNNRILQF